MSQPTQLPPAPPSVADPGALVYRSVSGLAVASLALAGLYAAVVVLSALLALVQGAPAFLPGWLLLLPLAGAALSLFARWRIARSEGTQTGTILARWAWWLSILAGLGYGAYAFATGLAVKQQANRFLLEKGEDSGFFARLQEGDINSAFLLTQPYTRRGDIDPVDLQAMEAEFDQIQGKTPMGRLSQFRNSEFVQAVVQAGRDGNPIEPLGTRDWNYDGGAYQVDRSYRIRTREATFEIMVPVRTGGEGAGGRKWFVKWEEVRPINPPELTPVGLGMRALRQDVRLAVTRWTQRMTEGHAAPNLKDLKDLTAWESLRTPRDARTTPAEIQQIVRKEVWMLLKGANKGHPGFNLGEAPLSDWEQVGGQLRVVLPFQLPIQPLKDRFAARYVASGNLVAQSREAIDPANPPPASSWDVVSFQVERVATMPDPMAKDKGPP